MHQGDRLPVSMFSYFPHRHYAVQQQTKNIWASLAGWLQNFVNGLKKRQPRLLYFTLPDVIIFWTFSNCIHLSNNTFATKF